jgi:hypothetical protein
MSRGQSWLDNAWIAVDQQQPSGTGSPRSGRWRQPDRTLQRGSCAHGQPSDPTAAHPAQPPGSHPPQDGQPDYVLWIYLGAESVFYPPGSVEEHLVIDHGIPSVDMHWKVKGYYSHEGDHHKQQGVRSGAVGDLVAVTHGHEQAA